MYPPHKACKILVRADCSRSQQRTAGIRVKGTTQKCPRDTPSTLRSTSLQAFCCTCHRGMVYTPRRRPLNMMTMGNSSTWQTIRHRDACGMFRQRTECTSPARLPLLRCCRYPLDTERTEQLNQNTIRRGKRFELEQTELELSLKAAVEGRGEVVAASCFKSDTSFQWCSSFQESDETK